MPWRMWLLAEEIQGSGVRFRGAKIRMKPKKKTGPFHGSPIEDYCMIGDCETVSGEQPEWLCWLSGGLHCGTMWVCLQRSICRQGSVWWELSTGSVAYFVPLCSAIAMPGLWKLSSC